MLETLGLHFVARPSRSRCKLHDRCHHVTISLPKRADRRCTRLASLRNHKLDVASLQTGLVRRLSVVLCCALCRRSTGRGSEGSSELLRGVVFGDRARSDVLNLCVL